MQYREIRLWSSGGWGRPLAVSSTSKSELKYLATCYQTYVNGCEQVSSHTDKVYDGGVGIINMSTKLKSYGCGQAVPTNRIKGILEES